MIRSLPLLAVAAVVALIYPALAQDGPPSSRKPSSTRQNAAAALPDAAARSGSQTESGRLTEIEPGTALDFETTAGASRRFVYRPTVGGEASIWARSEALDPSLEILDAEGKEAAFDEDSGGWKAAHLFIEIEKGVAREIIVRTKARGGRKGEEQAESRDLHDGAPASCRLMVVETVRSESTEALVLRLRSASEQMALLVGKGEHGGARARGREAFEGPLPPIERQGSDLAAALHGFGYQAWVAQDQQLASQSWMLGRAIHERVLPEEHPQLQVIRLNHALALQALGELEGARRLEERVLTVWERTLPEEHPALQQIRMNHAITLRTLGNLEGARSFEERALSNLERTLPENHPDLLRLRASYATTLRALGDLAGARALEERTLEVYERTLPAEHPDLQSIRANYANTLMALGELSDARALQERVLAVRERTLPEGHPDLQGIRMNYATTLDALGDLEGARAILARVLAVWEKVLPEEHPDLQMTRMNYAVSLKALGDLPGARALEEQVLAVRDRTLPAEHPDLQRIRANHAETLRALGDLAGARALQEQVLAVRDRTLPAEHPDLQKIRQNYALTLQALGDLERARVLEEKVLAIREGTLPEDHPDLQGIRANHALTLRDLGDLSGARALQERALEVYERTLPEEHPTLQRVRADYAGTLLLLGDLPAARALFEQVHEVWELALPREHPDLQAIRLNHTWTLSRSAAAGDEAAESLLAEHVVQLLETAIAASSRWEEFLSRRQGALRAAEDREVVDLALSVLRSGPGAARIGPSVILLTEELRAAGVRTLRLRTLEEGTSADLRESLRTLRGEVHLANRALEAFIASPELLPDAAAGETIGSRLAALVRRKEERERALGAALRELPGAERFLRALKVEDLASALPGSATGVGYSVYRRWTLLEPEKPTSNWDVTDHLVAFLLDREGRVDRVELGPLEKVLGLGDRLRQLAGGGVRGEDTGLGIGIEAADRRGSLESQLMRKLGEILWDPVAKALGENSKSIVLSLPAELALVPFDALVLEDGSHLGDRRAVSVVSSFSLMAREGPAAPSVPSLVALGDIDYGQKGAPIAEDEREILGTRDQAVVRRGKTTWGARFEDLPATREEISRIASLHREVWGDAGRLHVLDKSRAEHERLRALAPQARYLHIATHGWFAPESVPSILDRRETKDGIRLLATDFRDEVTGYEPLALCGLALAGANLSPDENGSHPGLLSGTEIATLDLSNCELAVLSACETNVGIVRAGQGIASLQEALFMAGARNTITSLWKVPDEATMELMTRFYEGIWRRGETKREALWNARKKLRDAKDARTGKAIYGLKDWAGWVLVGQPE